MSAYIVPPETIHVIAAWATVGESPFGVQIANEMRAADACRVLFAENARSVGHRYSENPSEISFEYLQGDFSNIIRRFPPELCLAAARCYEYQSCECSDYSSSAAALLVSRALKNAGQRLCDIAGIDSWIVSNETMKAIAAKAKA